MHSTIYSVPNPPGFGPPTSFGHSNQHSPEHGALGSSVHDAPQSPDYSSTYLSSYYAPDSLNYSTPGALGSSVHFAPHSPDYSSTHLSSYYAPDSLNYSTPHYSSNDTPLSSSYSTLRTSPGLTNYGFDVAGSTGSYYYGGLRPGYRAPSTFIYSAPSSSGYGTPVPFAYAPGSIGYGSPVFSGFIAPGMFGYDPRYVFFGNAPGSINYIAPTSSGHSTPATTESFTQTSHEYDAPFNTDHDSPPSSTYWIGYEYNLHTMFESNGRLIDRNDMDQAILRFFTSNKRYIPVVRLQSEAVSNDGTDTNPGFEHGPDVSYSQRGDRTSFCMLEDPCSGTMTQSRAIYNPTRPRGCDCRENHV